MFFYLYIFLLLWLIRASLPSRIKEVDVSSLQEELKKHQVEKPHKNLKFFITHGGQLSTAEAIHFGVPVIGLPVHGDQYVNMRAVERKGFGILVEMTEDVADGLSIAIDEMLKD